MSDLLGFNLDDKLVAILEGDKIKFRNFNNLRSIFDMSSYFAEATKQEISDFVNQPVLIYQWGLIFQPLQITS